MHKQYYYYLLKNEDIQEIITSFKLPNGDDSVFSNGFLDYQFLSDEELKNINFKIKYQQAIFYKNEVVIDVTPGSGGEDIIEDFDLRQDGYYEIELAGAGGGYNPSVTFLNHPNIMFWGNTVGYEKDIFLFDSDYTWTRYLEIPSNDQNIPVTYVKYFGNYLLTNEYIILNLLYTETEYTFYNVDKIIENSTFRDFPNEPPEFIKNNTKSVKTDSKIDNWSSSLLWFSLEDVKNSKFRTLNFKSSYLNKSYKIYNKETIIDHHPEPTTYYRNPEWSFNQYDTTNIEGESDAYEWLKETKKIISIIKEPPSPDYLHFIPPGDNTYIKHEGTWITKDYVLPIPITNAPVGGDGGNLHKYIKIQKTNLKYFVGKKSNKNSGGNGSALEIVSQNLFYTGGGNGYGAKGGYGNISSNNKKGIGQQNNSSTITNINECANDLTGINQNDNDLHLINLKREKVELSVNNLNNTDDYANDMIKNNTVIGYDITVNPSPKNLFYDKAAKNNQNDSTHYVRSLGGLGAGIVRTSTGINTFRDSENGYLKLKFLGLLTAKVYHNVIDIRPLSHEEGDKKYIEKNGIIYYAYIGVPDPGILSANIDKDIEVPPGTVISFKVVLNGFDTELDIFKSQIITYDDYDKLVAQEPGTETSLINNENVIIERITENIQKISYITVTQHTKLELYTRKRQYKVLFNLNDELLSLKEFGESDKFNSEEKKTFENTGWENGADVALELKYANIDRVINRDIFIKYNQLYQFTEGQKVNFDYNNKTKTEIITFKMPPHDILIPDDIQAVYKLTVEAMNVVNRPAINGLDPLKNGAVQKMELFYNKNENASFSGSMINEYVSPYQIIYVKVTFTEPRVRIDKVNSSMPGGTIIEKEGINLQDSSFEPKQQWFYFTMPEHSENVYLYIELRTYKLIIQPDEYNQLEILPNSGIYDYETGETCQLQFELQNFYKLSKQGGIIINGIKYELAQTEEYAIGGDSEYKRASIQYGLHYLTNGREFKKQNGNGKINFGYYSDIYEYYRGQMLPSEIIQFQVVFKNSDLTLKMDLTYVANSTLVSAGENSLGSVQLIIPGIYRIIIAGCKTGNGGSGSNGGIRLSTLKGNWKQRIDDADIEGKPGGAGGNGFIGGDGGNGTSAKDWQLTIHFWSSFIPYYFSINNETGGCGGKGGDGFYRGGKEGQPGTGALWRSDGDTGGVGMDILKTTPPPPSDDPKDTTHIRISQAECSQWRGAFLDCIAYISPGPLYYGVGTSGLDGQNAQTPSTPVFTDKAHWGAEGAGGGAGGPSYISFSQSQQYAILQYNDEAVIGHKDKVTGYYENQWSQGKPSYNFQSVYENFTNAKIEEHLAIKNNTIRSYIENLKNGLTDLILSQQNVTSNKIKDLIVCGGRAGDAYIIRAANGSNTGMIIGKDSSDNTIYYMPQCKVYVSKISSIQIYQYLKEMKGLGMGAAGGPQSTSHINNINSYYYSMLPPMDGNGIILNPKDGIRTSLSLGGRRGTVPVFVQSNIDQAHILVEKLKNIADVKIPLSTSSLYVQDNFYDALGYFNGNLHVPNDSGGVRIIYLGENVDRLFTIRKIHPLKGDIGIINDISALNGEYYKINATDTGRYDFSQEMMPDNN